MIYMKLAGAILVILSSSLLGISYSEDLKRRIMLFQEFRNLLCIVRSGIEYSCQLLVEIMEDAGRHVEGKAGELAGEVASLLLMEEKIDFYEAWEKAVKDTYEQTAVQSELSLFLEPGKVMGLMDARLRISGIDAAIELLDQKIKNEQAAMPEKCYRRKSLGFLFGLFVTIIFL